MSRTTALGTKLTALAMSTLLATATPLSATVAYAEESGSDSADGKTVEQGTPRMRLSTPALTPPVLPTAPTS